MCGRILLTSPAQVIADAFGVEPPLDLAPRWNIAPAQPVLAVRAQKDADGRELASFRWGLVPWWSKEMPVAATLINARSETAATTPAFRDAFRERRCLLPADGFYEWQTLPTSAGPRRQEQGELFSVSAPSGGGSTASGRDGTPLQDRRRRSAAAGPRQPFVIRLRDEAPFAIAGLWDRWRPRGGAEAPLESCALLTTTPNTLMEPIHDRMPVILPRSAWATWLDPAITDPERLSALLRPYPAEQMSTSPVSTWVNDPRHDDARCVEPA